MASCVVSAKYFRCLVSSFSNLRACFLRILLCCPPPPPPLLLPFHRRIPSFPTAARHHLRERKKGTRLVGMVGAGDRREKRRRRRREEESCGFCGFWLVLFFSSPIRTCMVVAVVAGASFVRSRSSQGCRAGAVAKSEGGRIQAKHIFPHFEEAYAEERGFYPTYVTRMLLRGKEEKRAEGRGRRRTICECVCGSSLSRVSRRSVCLHSIRKNGRRQRTMRVSLEMGGYVAIGVCHI